MEHISQNGMSCTDFELRLSDALDGVLSESEQREFSRHAEACMECGELFTRTQAGMNLLHGLQEVEPPANLVHNILAATVFTQPGQITVAEDRKASWLRRAADWASPGLVPAMARAMQPRFAMTAAMAFFSITLIVNMAGLKWSDLSRMDLRPSALTTEASLQYHETAARIVKYYENIRFVYELETRVRELREAAGTEEQNPPQQNEQPKRQPKPGDDSSREQKQQNRKQNEEYSRSAGAVEMAGLAMETAVNQSADIRRDS